MVVIWNVILGLLDEHAHYAALGVYLNGLPNLILNMASNLTQLALPRFVICTGYVDPLLDLFLPALYQV